MYLLSYDDVLENPKEYINSIHKKKFHDLSYGDEVFKNIQPVDKVDELEKYVTSLFPGYEAAFNFIRKSPLHQEEPNYIHTDEMMGDITCLLYLNDEHPNDDGTTIYDDEGKKIFTFYSKFNRLIVFNSDCPHSRNIFENFGEGEKARLIQVIFLKKDE